MQVISTITIVIQYVIIVLVVIKINTKVYYMPGSVLNTLGILIYIFL